MDFKEYLEFRADEESPVGVIAYDLLDDISFELADDELFKVLDFEFKEKVIFENWNALKEDYLAQK